MSIETLVAERVDMDEDFARLEPSLLEGLKDNLVRIIRMTLRKEKIERFDLTTMLMIDASIVNKMWLLKSFVVVELRARALLEMTEGSGTTKSPLEEAVNRRSLDDLIRRSEEGARDEIRSKFTDDNEASPNWDEPCRICGKCRVHMCSRQMRSADEAPTLFFECLSCGARWTG